MAIAKIRKIEIIGLEEDKDRLLALLQRLAIVELIEGRLDTKTTLIQADNTVNLFELEENISYLETFKEKISPLKSIVMPKPVVYERELEETVSRFDYKELLRGLAALRNHIKELNQHKERLIHERSLLLPWKRLKIPTVKLDGTQNCGVSLGTLRTQNEDNLLEDLKKEDVSIFCETIDQDKLDTHLLIIYLKNEFALIENILKAHHFNFVVLGRYPETVADRLLEANGEILLLDDEIEDIKYKISKLAHKSFSLKIIYDYLGNIYNRAKEAEGLPRGRYTFLLKGWIKVRDEKSLKKMLTDNFKDTATFISDPESGEEIPVDLENPPLLQPFEFITKIYGFPKYNEIDPTPYLAPFFFLYFGFCISDAGYGFILALFSLFVLRKFTLGPQGLRFFKLFLFCSISTIIIGALTGSWFGNLVDLFAAQNSIFAPVKRFKDSLVILDPLKEPTKLLGIALSLGIVQVWFGNIVAAIGNFKNRRYLNILLDQATMLTLLFGLTGLGLIFLGLLNKDYIVPFRYAALLGAVGLMLTQGRTEKGLGSKLFFGVYNLYSALSGYLSDILSYSRLWALGLVTGVMAMTINLISIQFASIFTSIIPFVDKIAFIKVLLSSIILVTIFICGHLMSFLMNLLGAFVHPLRLQFVEFFSKFFKGGGNPFKPFKVETKYINIK